MKPGRRSLHRRRWLRVLAGAVPLLLLGAANHVQALNPELSLHQYSLRSYQRGTGLPANAIVAMAQGADGHLWLGTQRGLVDFDGSEFRFVGLPGQTSNRPTVITSLERRRDGGLWVGIEHGGLGHFDGKVFHPLKNPELPGDFGNVLAVHQAKDGRLYLAYIGSSLCMAPDGGVVHLSDSLDIQCVQEDNRGRIWLGTATHGLFYIQDGKLQPVLGEAAKLWESAVVSSVAVDREGLIWVGTSNGLLCLGPDLQPRNLPTMKAQPLSLLVDSKGSLWVGTLEGGLFRRRGNYWESLGHREGLAGKRVMSLLETSDGTLWIGTEDGLSQLSDVSFPILGSEQGLPVDSCLCVAPAADDGLWAGTPNGLVRLKEGKTEVYGRMRADGFASEWIKELKVGKNGDLCLLGGNRSISLFRDGRVIKNWVTEEWAQAIAEDDEGFIVSVGKNLRRIRGGQLVPYEYSDPEHNELSWINDLHRARDGSLWLATKQGLFQIKDGHLVNHSRNSELTDRSCYFLWEEADGAIWSTQSSGLLRCKEGKLAFINHEKGLVEDYVYSAVDDDDGYLWLDSVSGLFRVHSSQLNAVADGAVSRLHCERFDGQHFVKSTELASKDFSACKTKDGRLWFPSARGLICITPSVLSEHHPAPPVQVSRVRVDGVQIDTTDLLSIRPGINTLEFDYTATDFVAPELLHYRYRLRGYQDDWIDAGTRRFALFTNMPAGRFTFEVQACSADGVWNTEPAVQKISIPPTFTQRPEFKIIAGLCALGLFALAMHLYERRRLRELQAVRQREEFQRQMLESSPVAMAILDGEGLILQLNASFQTLFGYGMNDLQDIEDFLNCCHTGVAEPSLAALLRDKQAPKTGIVRLPSFELEVLCKDGTRRFVQLDSGRLENHTLLAFADLTAHKRAETERLRLEQELRQSQKMEAIGKLSGGIAHDFNNLLTVILGNVSLMETDPHLDETLADSIEGIKGASQRAADLTRQLLAFSRKQHLQVRQLDLNEVVAEMMRMFQRLLGDNIILEHQRCERPLLIDGDAGMMEQVLLNLAVNARDAMPAGGRIRIECLRVIRTRDRAAAVSPGEDAEPKACLRFTDTGCGIEPEILPHIFDPFFTTKETGKGSGLGLATVYGIIEQHNGWIEVESQPGQGTSFSLFLPLSRDPEKVDGKKVPKESDVRLQAGRARRILLVEDDPAVRALACKGLKHAGHSLLEAASGAEALELWRQHRTDIDLLFTDIMMPGGLTGLELARRLHEESPSLPVLYTSGYSEDLIHANPELRQSMHFLPKPYKVEMMLAMIARLP